MFNLMDREINAISSAQTILIWTYARGKLSTTEPLLSHLIVCSLMKNSSGP